MPRLPGALVVALALLLAAPAAASALPPAQPDTGAWVPNGPVSTVARHGSTTYLGGFFDWVGPWTGLGASISVPGGIPNAHFPIIAGGHILASAPDGAGGVFIGGSFTSVGGQPIANLAHIRADDSVDNFPETNGSVTTLAFVPGTGGLVSTDHLYVGGQFTAIGGIQRQYLAEVDISAFGDSISDTFAPCPNYTGSDASGDQPYPFALAVSSTTVYVGGDFDTASGGPANPTTHAPTCTGTQNASHLFAVSRSSGAVSATFLPDPGGEVDALSISPDGTRLYVGGQFNSFLPSIAITGLAAVNTTSGVVDTSWKPQPSGIVKAIQATASGVYAGGSFTTIGANQLLRPGVAQLDATTADATAFDAGLTQSPETSRLGVWTLALDGAGHLAIGGYFATSVGEDELALLDPTTGAVQSAFKPQPGGLVASATFTDSSSLFAGGYFDSIGAVHRAGIVALDGHGHPLPTVFAGAARVRQVAISSDGLTIYATGDNGTGAWSTSTGAQLPWTAPCCVAALAVAPDGSRVYLGGGFTTVGGSPHVHLAAVSPTTGAPASWRPDPDGLVDAIAVSPDGATVYAGGTFQHAGSSVSPRSNLAAISAASGDATPWSPNPNAAVESLAVTGDGAHVFAGGVFSSIGAQPQPRANLAELTASTANPTPFAPAFGPNTDVSSIAPAKGDSVVYSAGQFTQIASNPFPGIAALDGGNGHPLSWTPGVGSGTLGASIAADGDTVWVGNEGTPLGADLRPYFAQFSTTPVSIAPPALSHAPQAGASLICLSGGWQNAPATLTVSWSLDGSAIAGAGARTFAPTSAQVGHKLSCTETAANPGGAASATSPSASVAAAPTPTPTPKPSPSPVIGVQIKPTRFHRGRGTTLRIKLSAAASVRLTLTRLLQGHQTKHGCKLSVKRGRRCTVKRSVGSITWRLRAGVSTQTLKLVGAHKLAAGSYIASFTATAGTRRSRALEIKLTVLR